MKKFIQTFILIVASAATVNAQISLNNEITLPSTDVWNFMKYGDVGTNLYTGTLNLKIPIYTYKDADFEIPVSIDYSSNGYMPNIRTGILGLGWNLNVGGYITREIKGLPDDETVELRSFTNYACNISENTNYGSLFIDAFYHTKGFLSLWKQSKIYNSNLFIPSIENLLVTSCSNANLLFYDNRNNSFFDAEPDIFHFNFMGYSGTFQLGYNGEIHVYNSNINNDNFKIKTDNLYSISIITNNGYKYVFGILDSNRSALDEIFYEGNGIPYSTVIAFKLLEIESPNGRKVKFYYSQSYQENSYNIPISLLKKTHELIAYPLLCNPGCGYNSMTINDAGYSATKTSYLDSIKIDNGVKIFFNHIVLNNIDGYYLSFSDDRVTYSHEDKLSNVKVINTSNEQEIKNVNISYKTSNGSKVPFIAKIDISGEGEYIMNYYGENEYFPYSRRCNYDHWGYYNGNNNYKWDYFINSIQNPGINEILPNNMREPNPLFSIKGMLKEIIYPTKGKSVFEYEAHNYSQNIRKNSGGLIDNIETDKIAGGLRIKKITNYIDNETETNSKEFLYLNNNNRSSGRLLYYPHYSIKYSSQYLLTGTPYYLEQFEGYFLSGILPINTTHIEYDRVIEINNDNSNVIHNYSNYSIIPDKFTYSNDMFPYDYYSIENIIKQEDVSFPWGIIPGLRREGQWTDFTSSEYPNGSSYYQHLLFPPNSMQGERGKLLSKEMYDADNNILFKENSHYNTNKQLKYFPTPVYLAHQYGFYKRYIDNFDIIRTTRTQRVGNNEITEHTSYTYNSHGQISTSTVTDSKGDKVITSHKYVTDLQNPVGIYKDMLDNNVINNSIEDSVYILKSGTNQKTLMEWKKYNYYQPNTAQKALISLQSVDDYDKQESSWIRSATFVHDKKGRMLEKADNNGIKTVYIWGYNGLYPVAKVENCNLAQVKNISGLGNIETTSLPDGINAYENALRNIHGAQVTTLEYYPFVGLKKVTDPSGKTMMYDYNATGKLKSVVDDADNLRNKYYYSTDDKN
jgi:YD repeat-containing protein